jgi:hypothetical protein
MGTLRGLPAGDGSLTDADAAVLAGCLVLREGDGDHLQVRRAERGDELQLLYGGEVIGSAAADARTGSRSLILVTSGLSSAAHQARNEVHHAAGVFGVDIVRAPAAKGPAVEAQVVKAFARSAPLHR